MKIPRRIAASTGIAVLCLSALAMTPAVAAEKPSNKGQDKTVTLTAQLNELNGSGTTGTATAVVRNQKILRIDVNATGLTPNAPHAQHIHFGAQARHECPTVAQDDENGDGRIITVEGIPAYGPIAVSLTTTGDTSPASALAVSRFPVSSNGKLDYRRDKINIGNVAGGTAKEVADAIRAGEGVLVVHGIDYDGNGMYNVSDPEGVSELDRSLPAEVTDPAACGVLH